VGLNLEDANVINGSVINQHDIKPTVIETINAISFLLGEIKLLQQKYQLRKFPPLEKPTNDAKSSPASKGLRTLSIIRSSSLRQRMKANQREKSVISIAKWALRDAKKFDEKVKRLKSLIDGLEDISRVAGILSSSQPTPEEVNPEPVQENPPPYSFAATLISPNERPHIVDISRTTRTPRLSDNSISDLLEHHSVMKRYLAAIPAPIDQSRGARARERLVQLSEQQFKELRIDVFDELLRRQQFETSRPDCLPNFPSFHPRRNEARRKLSTVITDRFGHLVFDVVFELERRFPQLQDRAATPPPPMAESPNPFANCPSYDTRRWGYVRSADGIPPPLLHERAAYQPARSPSPPLNLVSPSSYSKPNIEISQTFRISMTDRTSKVLPAALMKYNIHAPWQLYNLYLMYGDQERCLGLEEQPLLLFKQLDREGHKPMFMLRRDYSSVASRPEGNLPSSDNVESSGEVV